MASPLLSRAVWFLALNESGNLELFNTTISGLLNQNLKSLALPVEEVRRLLEFPTSEKTAGSTLLIRTNPYVRVNSTPAHVEMRCSSRLVY